jgi:hypothetical protein
VTDILRIAGPLTVWLAAFSAVYGLEGLVCSQRWAEAGLSPAAGRAALVGAWAVAALLQLALLLALRSQRFASPSGFVQGVGLSLSLVALLATIWTMMPVATVSLCL